MTRIFGTVLAALAGLAFGSFLNVCLNRWPAGESVIKPRSHCRACGRTLAWLENVPLVSWIALRGRCRTCGTPISWRYPLVELAVGLLWAVAYLRCAERFAALPGLFVDPVLQVIGLAILIWLLVGLAVLDAESLWLPDAVTLPGIAAGLAFAMAQEGFGCHYDTPSRPLGALLRTVLSALIGAGLVLLIRWSYWLIRRREGIGLGDAKLMAMLAAWLGLRGALLAFAIGVVLGACTALILLAVPVARRGTEIWSLTKLPLGTFLCIGGIISALWGQQILAAYLRWSGVT
jgi:leader peptidase (prepilin peptidase)/N-methyltransferase